MLLPHDFEPYETYHLINETGKNNFTRTAPSRYTIAIASVTQINLV
jgi:hypothetical protein